MKSMLYPKLAWQNLKNNRTTYFPYLLTCSVSVAMYYIMQSITLNGGLAQVPGAAIALTIFFLGTGIVGIFCVALIFWTNSFLIKRRKKELGLYCVLGMERGHIAAMLLWETLYTAVICLVLGLGAGMLLSKLLFLGLLYMMDISTPIAFGIEPAAMLITAVLFGAIFLCTLAYNLYHVRLAKPVELLRGGSMGEKEPRASWLLAVVGVLSLGWGYYTAVTVSQPLNALLLFFAAVLCVILGTFCLFTAGSIAFLKWLRRRKNFYYQPGHFISVSGMIYRMKQNAAGLAAICILFTMVLVTVSTTVCLYTGQSDTLRTLYPTDIRGSVTLEGGQNLEDVYQAVESAVQQSGSRVEQQYAWRTCSSGNAVSMDENGVLREDNASLNTVQLLGVEDYNRAFGASQVLAEDEALLWCTGKSTLPQTVTFAGHTLAVRPLEGLPEEVEQFYSSYGAYIMVVSSYEQAAGMMQEFTGKEAGAPKVNLFLNVSGSPAQQQRACQSLVTNTPEGMPFNVNSRAAADESWYGLYGSFLFLGLYLGLMFMMATVLIIYYKQISEGYDDHDRFVILQNVGMSRQEVRSTINKQILLVFFLPLLMAAVHMLFAFNIVTNILTVFSMTNRALFAICCVCIFAVFSLAYLLVYKLTSRSYYRLVRAS